MGVTRTKLWLTPVALWLLGSCESDRSGEALAKTRFEEFQTALLARDAASLRDLVCADARPAIRALCLEDRSETTALQVTGVTRRQYDYLVHVSEPRAGGQASHFVLTVEDGVMRVDLRATYRDHSVEKRRFLAEERFIPQRLTPEQIEQARVIHQPAPAAPAPPKR